MFSLANSEAINKAATMSSREVADLTGKQHKHVLDDCRKMFDSLKIQSADFSADYQDERGRTYQEFLLDQDLTMTLVMGYSIPLRHKVAKRWRNWSRLRQRFPKTCPRHYVLRPISPRRNSGSSLTSTNSSIKCLKMRQRLSFMTRWPSLLGQ